MTLSNLTRQVYILGAKHTGNCMSPQTPSMKLATTSYMRSINSGFVAFKRQFISITSASSVEKEMVHLKLVPKAVTSRLMVIKCNRRWLCTRTVEEEGEVRVRFAPSPTGMMHLGGLKTALYNYLFARSHGGKFILRIEDTDETRIVPGAYENLIEVLDWVGMTPDEGPHVGGEYGPYVQTQRLPIYQEKIQDLLKTGAAYKCFCSDKRMQLLRKEAANRREVYKYDNKCRSLTPEEIEQKSANNEPYTVRLKLETYKEPWEDIVYGPIICDIASSEGDPILMKSNHYPTYHFANVIDDHLMGITHVLRGVEWQGSTTKHLLLYKAFGWQPPKYAHLPLIVNSDGKKFSKRQDDTRVEYFMNKNYIPDAVLNLITLVGGGFTINQPSGKTLQELVPLFSITSIVPSPGKLDLERVNQMHKLHLIKRLQDTEQRKTVIEQLKSLALNKFNKDGKVDDAVFSDEFIGKILDWLIHERIYRIEELVEEDWEFLWTAPTQESVKSVQDLLQNNPDCLAHLISELENISRSEFTQENIPGRLKKFAKKNNYKSALCMKLIRKAISNQPGPPVAEMLSTLGKDISIQRLKYVLNHFE